MTKPQVAHSIKDRESIKQNEDVKRMKARTLRVSALSLATAVSALGLSQVACAELTWGEEDSYQQEGSYQQNSGYQSDNGVSSFTAAAIAAERGDVSALYNYEQAMSGGLFAMYPTYWRMNLDLNSQSSAAVSQFVRQYPNTVMAEKLVADFAETKAGSNDYASVRQVANLITNADASERCAVALGFNNGGDTMRAMAAKSEVWLTTKKQPALCDQLAMEMNNNALISNEDRAARLKRMLRKGKTGDIMALSSRLGTPIAYSALSEIQLNPSAFLAVLVENLPVKTINTYIYMLWDALLTSLTVKLHYS